MNKIKEFRTERGLKQIDLAQILKTTKATISNWELQITEPSIENIIAMANYFDCTIDELLCRDPAEPSHNDGIKITPLARRLLDAFEKMGEEDQRKFVGMAEALAVMS